MSKHRGLSRPATACHLLAGLTGEYGPHVQQHLTWRYVSAWLTAHTTHPHNPPAPGQREDG